MFKGKIDFQKLQKLCEDFSFKKGILLTDVFETSKEIVVIFSDIDIGEHFYYKLEKTYKEDIFKLFDVSIGHQKRKEGLIRLEEGHPLFRGDLTPYIKMAGENVTQVYFETGHLYMGLEDKLLNSDHKNMPDILSHLNPLSSPTASILWSMSFENLLKADVSSRVKVLRMLFLELARIRSHLNYFASSADVLGLNILSSRIKEELLSLRKLFFDYGLSYAHPHFSFIGGISKDMPSSWPFNLNSTLKSLEKFLNYFQKEFFENNLVLKRTNLSPMNIVDAFKFSLSGPLIRSQGIRLDYRKKTPFYFYSELDFEVPLGDSGKIFERFLIRFEELKESIKILKQIFNYIPSGKIQEEISLFGDNEGYFSIESPEGELGIFLSMKEGKLESLRLRRPSAFHLKFAQKHLSSSFLSDFFVNYSSFNLSLNEVDS